MPNSKPKVTKPPTSSSNGKTPKPETITNPVPPADLFPFAQYASVVGVHIILVGFTTLYLPQTTHFMEVLTADPVLTLIWICGGLVIVQVWWASWLTKWYFEQTARGTEDEIKVDRVRFNNLRFKLIFVFIIIKRLTEATAFTMCAAVATWLVVIMFGGCLWQDEYVLLTSFVPAFTLGYPSLASDTSAMINRMTWMRLFAELSPRNALERAMVYPAVGTVLGSWFGAIPIDNSWCGINTMIELYIPAGRKVSRFSSLRKNGTFVIQSLLLVNFWIKLVTGLPSHDLTKGHGVILPSASTAHVPRFDESNYIDEDGCSVTIKFSVVKTPVFSA
ncbi:hypothetical protein BU15DRAFT_68059 [Melanogaster broomeanus]|nr:hypothetical protein BU15DRAFT_68059 [Melanogaster broomeanus]